MYTAEFSVMVCNVKIALLFDYFALLLCGSTQMHFSVLSPVGGLGWICVVVVLY